MLGELSSGFSYLGSKEPPGAYYKIDALLLFISFTNYYIHNYGPYYVTYILRLIAYWLGSSGFITFGEWRGAFAHIPRLTHSSESVPARLPARGDAL